MFLDVGCRDINFNLMVQKQLGAIILFVYTRGPTDHKYFARTVLYNLSVEQSDSRCLVHSHFGFGSDPFIFVRVISGKA